MLEHFIQHLGLMLYTDLGIAEQAMMAKSFRDLMGESPEVILGNLKPVYDCLVSNFQSIKADPLFQSFKENEVYQRSLQKLDSEIRHHLKQEMQMKLMLDDVKAKIKSYASIDSYTEDRVKFLLATKSKLLDSIKTKNTEIASLNFIEVQSDELELSLLKENCRQESEAIGKYEKKIQKAQKKIQRKQEELQYINEECRNLKDVMTGLQVIVKACDEKIVFNGLNSVREDKDVKRLKGKVLRQAKVISPVCVEEEKTLNIGRLSQSTKRIRYATWKCAKEAGTRSRSKIRLQMYAAKH